MKTGLMGAAIWSLFALAMAEDVTVKPAGMQIVWDGAKDDFGGFPTYNLGEGAGVSLIVKTAKGRIIDVPNRSINLTIGGIKARTFFTTGDTHMSKDGSKVRLDLTASGKTVFDDKGLLPVEGKITVVTASQTAEVKSESLKFAADTVVKFPESAKLPEIKVVSAGKPKWGNGVWEIVLAANQDLEGIAKFRFVEKDGNVIEAKLAGSSRGAMLGKVNVQLNLELTKPVEEGILLLDIWADKAKVEVPVSFKLGNSVAQ